jgi:hypothetical protein
MVRRNTLVATALAALLATACDSPRPTPSVAPVPTSAAAETATPSPSPSTTESPPAPPPPVAVDLINAAVDSGQIDVATGYLYRSYALWGDPRLPEQFHGARIEDLMLGDAILRAFPDLGADEQAMLLPFLVRPTHAESYWTADPGSHATAHTGGQLVAAQLADDPRCGGGSWSRRDLAAIPVTLWGRCEEVAGFQQLTLGDAMDRAERTMNRLYRLMKALMGDPIPDSYRGPIGAVLEVAEQGDGRLDIYIVTGPNQSYGRVLDVGGNQGIAVPTNPTGDVTSAYIVVNPAASPQPNEFESTLAHEYFHVLEMRNAWLGTRVCPYPNTTTTCPDHAKQAHWFVEASATWAEHEWVPEGRPSTAYPRFEAFLRSPVSLADTVLDNEYDSYMWPLFMEQESGRGATVVTDAWKAIAGRSGWTDVQAAIDGQMSFDTKFREFAVRLWNEQLPGMPINPLFRHGGLDPSFPPTRPDEVGSDARYVDEAIFAIDRQFTDSVDIPEMWALYYRVRVPTEAKRITFNFAGIAPNPKLDVDALVKIKGRDWERRQLDTVTEWCLEKPADAIEALVLVMSNHSQTPTEHLRGDWTVQGDLAGCAAAGGEALVYTSLREQGTEGDDFYQAVSESLTLQVRLKSSSTGYGLEDDGSTFRAGVDVNGTIKGLPGCDTLMEASGGGGGLVESSGGGINGTIARVVTEPPFGSTAEPVAKWVLVIAASVYVDTTGSMSSCGGSTSNTGSHYIELPPGCEGTEISDTAAGQVFDFNCSSTTPGWVWSIVGKITVQT